MKYTLTNRKVKVFEGKGGWYYIDTNQAVYDEISTTFADLKRGFGSLKVAARIGTTTWHTSIFPDTKAKRYILFIKKQVRQKGHISLGDAVTVQITIKT